MTNFSLLPLMSLSAIVLVGATRAAERPIAAAPSTPAPRTSAFEAGECQLVPGAGLTAKKGAKTFAYILKNVGAFSLNPADVRFFDPNGLTAPKTIRNVLIDERNEPGIVMKADASPENDLIMITSQGQAPGSSKKTLVVLSMAEGQPSSVKFSGICAIEYTDDLDRKVAQFQSLSKGASKK